MRHIFSLNCCINKYYVLSVNAYKLLLWATKTTKNAKMIRNLSRLCFSGNSDCIFVYLFVGVLNANSRHVLCQAFSAITNYWAMLFWASRTKFTETSYLREYCELSSSKRDARAVTAAAAVFCGDAQTIDVILNYRERTHWIPSVGLFRRDQQGRCVGRAASPHLKYQMHN